MKIVLDDNLAQHLALVAARHGETVQQYGEALLRDEVIREDPSYVDPVWQLKDGRIMLKPPPGSPVLTVEEVNRLAWSDPE